MTDLLLATLTVVVLVGLGLVALAALTVVPFVVTLQLAQARQFSLLRWGVISLTGSVFGLAAALLVPRGDGPAALAAAGLLPILAGPALLLLLPPRHPLGGRAGRHQ